MRPSMPVDQLYGASQQSRTTYMSQKRSKASRSECSDVIHALCLTDSQPYFQHKHEVQLVPDIWMAYCLFWSQSYIFN